MVSKTPSGTRKGKLGEKVIQEFLIGENEVRKAIGKKEIKKVHKGRDFSDDY